MNKYLLLRDNKESGPYTVTQLIEKGIKAYDLVWLEGKSAAWRYPSEVEELKAYAPAVEEQPFDRFYKRPEPVQNKFAAEEIQRHTIVAPQPEYSSYAPKVDEPANVDVPVQKKVYINFPVAPDIQKKIAASKEPKASPVNETYTSASMTSNFAEQSYKRAPEVVASHNFPVKKESTDKRFVYAAAAACLVLVGIVAILFINNKSQQEKLRELNTIVKQIENKRANETVPSVAQVKNEQAVPAPVPQTSETIVNPELLNADDHNAPPTTANQTKPETTPASEPSTVARHTVRKPQQADGVVFTERTVARRGDDSDPAQEVKEVKPTVPSSSENLFKLVNVTPNNYKTGLLGGISNLQLHITNKSNRELQKVAIQINYLGPEKKVVNTQTVYFENISAGGESTIDVPKSKRGVTINYTITDIKS